MKHNQNLENKFDIIQNEIYTIDNIRSIIEDIMHYWNDETDIYAKLITLIDLQKEHIKKITNLF